MKKNKKTMNSAPVAETKTLIPGSVGEFIALLEQFPEDGKFNLNGSAHVDISEIGEFKNGATGVTIYPRESVCDDCASENCMNGDCNHSNCSGKCNCDAAANSDIDNDELSSIADNIMREHCTGIVYNDPAMLNELRDMNAEAIFNAPIMTPNKGELFHECRRLGDGQLLMINDIREHNKYVAECLGEIRRREVAALLEYNTQCLARFGIVSNRTMCDIVQNPISKDNEDYGYLDDDEV